MKATFRVVETDTENVARDEDGKSFYTVFRSFLVPAEPSVNMDADEDDVEDNARYERESAMMPQEFEVKNRRQLRWDRAAVEVETETALPVGALVSLELTIINEAAA